ncbi:MAG: 7,8-dihydro-8-oxoguanine triphosphatase [Candidatus Parcubacteria bacterium]
MKIVTLCLIQEDSKILLGLKKRGFGEGRWNGFGGKVEEGESIEEATIRETQEECGVHVADLIKVGIVDFLFQDGSKQMQVHFFRPGSYIGEPTETEEMKPQWFDVDEIPFSQMWPDDIYWFPLFLEGKKFKGRFLFDRPSGSDHTSVILEHALEEVSEL